MTILPDIDSTTTETRRKGDLSESIYQFLRETATVGLTLDPEVVAIAMFGPEAVASGTTRQTAVLSVCYTLAVWGYAFPMRNPASPKRPRFRLDHKLTPPSYRQLQRKHVSERTTAPVEAETMARVTAVEVPAALDRTSDAELAGELARRLTGKAA